LRHVLDDLAVDLAGCWQGRLDRRQRGLLLLALIGATADAALLPCFPPLSPGERWSPGDTAGG
jgi:hypothetical protein